MAFGKYEFSDPVVGIAVEPKTKADVDKLGMSLAKLAEEDPFKLRQMRLLVRPLSLEWVNYTFRHNCR